MAQVARSEIGRSEIIMSEIKIRKLPPSGGSGGKQCNNRCKVQEGGLFDIFLGHLLSLDVFIHIVIEIRGRLWN